MHLTPIMTTFGGVTVPFVFSGGFTSQFTFIGATVSFFEDADPIVPLAPPAGINGDLLVAGSVDQAGNGFTGPGYLNVVDNSNSSQGWKLATGTDDITFSVAPAGNVRILFLARWRVPVTVTPSFVASATNGAPGQTGLRTPAIAASAGLEDTLLVSVSSNGENSGGDPQGGDNPTFTQANLTNDWLLANAGTVFEDSGSVSANQPYRTGGQYYLPEQNAIARPLRTFPITNPIQAAFTDSIVHRFEAV